GQGVFLDLGGADQYPSSVSGFGTTGVFLDTQAPAGSDAPNGHLVRAGSDSTVPAVPSPLTLVVDQGGLLSDVSLDTTPAVVRLRSAISWDGVVRTTVPASIQMKDDRRQSLEFSCQGPVPQHPDVCATNGQDLPVTATYVGTSEGDWQIHLSARDPVSGLIYQRAITPPVTVDGTPPRLDLAFRDGTADDLPDTVYHSENDPDFGVIITASDSGSG